MLHGTLDGGRMFRRHDEWASSLCEGTKFEAFLNACNVSISRCHKELVVQQRLGVSVVSFVCICSVQHLDTLI